ncbi:CARDB domain-containing protein, partial [Candidatus Poribacteria bacterium]
MKRRFLNIFFITFLAFFSSIVNAAENLPVDCIRQVGDTSETFDGRMACGATSAVMIAAYHNRLPVHTITCTFCPPSHPSDYGWYISERYTLYGYTYDREHPTLTGIAQGAYGYIHDYTDSGPGSAYPTHARGYFRRHGLFSKVIYSPDYETDVKAEIDKGHPVWASTNLWPYGHIVVIKGYTDDDHYIVNDPWIDGDEDGDLDSQDWCDMGNDMQYTWGEMGVGSKWIVTADPISPGNRVEALYNSISVRREPRLGAISDGYVYAGDKGTILDDPVYGCFYNADSYTWWKIQWDNGKQGWSACGNFGYLENWIEKIESTEEPDLIVDDIWIDPDPPDAGNFNRVWFRIKNQGSGDTVGFFRSKLYFDGVYRAYADKNGLIAGSSQAYYWDTSWPSDYNSYTVRVVVDADGAITESNEGNNERSESFSATPPTDTTPPPAPVISSSSHAENVWSSNDDLSFSWTEPSDTSGISGYSYALTANPSAIPDVVSEGTSRSKSYFNIADGTWYFYVRARDGAGNWGPADHYGPVKIDDTPPAAPISLTALPSDWTNNSVFSIGWTDPSDPSGIDKAYYRIGSAPSSPTDGIWSTISPFPAAATSEGGQAIYVWLMDGAGNLNHNNRDTAILYYDATSPSNPTSCTETHGVQSGVDQNTVNDPSFTWSGASDSASGIDNYYYYWGTNASGTSTTYTALAGYDPSAVSPGTYYLRLKTRDNAGNDASWTTVFTFIYSAPNDPPVLTGIPDQSLDENTSLDNAI